MSSHNDAVVAVFAHHPEAEDAVRKLAHAGFDMKRFSIVGKGNHTEEKVIGFYNSGDRIEFWGRNGALWGGLWGLFFGGMMLTIPVIGPVVILGHLAVMVFSALERAVVVGGLSALGAALFGIGIPKDSVITYEEALKADGFMIVGHGLADDIARARTILEAARPARLDLHENVTDVAAANHQPGHHQAA